MNKAISRYISKNMLFPEHIKQTPKNDLEIIVVIPCHNESRLYDTLDALNNCVDPNVGVEVIVSINASIEAPYFIKKKNENSLQDVIIANEESPSWMNIYGILNNGLSEKKAGVGLGRKIGMDEAVRRFISLDKDQGVIVCFDADSLCEKDYFVGIKKHFENKDIRSASIHYEHPIGGVQFDHAIYQSIVQYELHLRYFIRQQKRIGLPYAYHTIGSSMACRVESYCAVGGMNQRKAGEDFYFIHKLVKNGGHSELNNVTVIPSPRISDRVPFGTGKAIGEMIAENRIEYMTYNPSSFSELAELPKALKEIYDSEALPSVLTLGISSYLIEQKVIEMIKEMKSNTKDYSTFVKRFWRWFDAFQLMKCLHYLRDHFYPDVPITDAMSLAGFSNNKSAEEMLIKMRLLDKSTT